ncbi:MAG: hypothetical protein IMY84_05785 [Chloroflexi bacterium]|nr:hypothetical protein [Chloroflexota bacterium]
MEKLTREEAESLCSQVREQNQATLFTSERMQCWHCTRSSGGDPDRMYMAAKPGYLGCSLMNKLRRRMERSRSF